MEDPIFVRRGQKGELIEQRCLMPAKEVLANKRILLVSGLLAGEVDMIPVQDLADDLREGLLCLDAISHDPIKLIISSPGGMVRTTLTLYDVIKTIKAPVWTYGHLCASAASLLLAAGEKGHRFMYPHGQVMLHLPEGSVSGTTKIMATRSKEYDRLRDEMVKLLIDCGATKSHTEILEDLDGEYWMTAQEVIGYGLADRIVGKGELLE